MFDGLECQVGECAVMRVGEAHVEVGEKGVEGVADDEKGAVSVEAFVS